MESYAVCQLMAGTRFEGFLLVRSSSERKDVRGNSYVDINLADRTGEINGKIWNWDEKNQVPAAGSVIKVSGLAQEYNSRLQFRIERWRQAVENDPVDMNRLVPSAPRPPEEMRGEIMETVKSFSSEKLRKLTEQMLEDTGERLNWFPAAQRMHHAEYGGLLHHTTDMLRLGKGVLEVYPWLNRDVLLAGIIIHDLGKTEELKSDRSGNVTDYTRDGQLLGHLVRGITNLREAARKTGVDGELLVLMEHMLLSHHGESEYGSPKPPMFPEAEALHWIDIMDARMNTMKTAADKTPEGAFSEKIIGLDRRVYHPRYSDDAE